MDSCRGRRRTASAWMGITETASKVVKLGKSAIDSAFYNSLNGGMHMHTTKKQNLRGELSSNHCYGDRKPSQLVVEQLKAKQENVREDMKSGKQQNDVSTLKRKEYEILEQFSDEPLKCSTPTSAVTCRKKIFIRSRL